MARMTYDTFNKNLDSWNSSHPEMPVKVTKDITGTRILTADTMETLIFDESIGRAWDKWCIFSRAYNIGFKMAKLGKEV